MNKLKLTTQYQAATKIQSLVRGDLARKRVNQIKNNAATKIQKNFREYMDKNSLVTQNEDPIVLKFKQNLDDILNEHLSSDSSVTEPMQLAKDEANKWIKSQFESESEELKADINTPINDGLAPVYIAACMKHPGSISVLEKLGVVVDGAFSLHMAAQQGDIAAIRNLIELDADVNARNRDGETPLHMAAQQGDIAAIRMLVDCGADVNASNNEGETPLHLAAEQGYKEAIRMLVECRAEVNAPDNENIAPLSRAIISLSNSGDNKYISATQQLLAFNANVNASNLSLQTPMHYAARTDSTFIIRTLAGLGADVNARNHDGETPVHEAAMFISDSADKICVLAELGADVNARNNDGETPVFIAAKEGNLNEFCALAKWGADVNTPNNERQTPSSQTNNDDDIAKLIIIVNHLDQNNSIDTLTSDTQNFTSNQLKAFYNVNKNYIDCLMEQRKSSPTLALSIVHNPIDGVLPDDFNKEGVVKHSLSLMKTNNRVRFLPSFSKFPIKLGDDEWNFDVFFGPIISFFTIQDLGKLAQVNKEFKSNFFTSSANGYFSKLISYLISQEDGVQILIDANKRALTSHS